MKKNQKNQAILLIRGLKDQLKATKHEGNLALAIFLVLFGTVFIFMFVASEYILSNLNQMVVYAVLFFLSMLLIGSIILYYNIKNREKKLRELIK